MLASILLLSVRVSSSVFNACLSVLRTFSLMTGTGSKMFEGYGIHFAIGILYVGVLSIRLDKLNLIHKRLILTRARVPS